MKILFVADGRSPIALSWMRYWVEAGHSVHLASTYPCAPDLRLASLSVIPAAFGEVAGQPGGSGQPVTRSLLRRLVPVGLRTFLREWLGPLTLGRASRRLRTLIDTQRPDLVHALRIPFEGILAAQAVLISGRASPPPLVVSVWGNDFTLHAHATPGMASLTRKTLQNVQGVHTDCARDLRLAREWGFGVGRPAIVLPTNGGLDLKVFYPPRKAEVRQNQDIPKIINPRGVRAYVRNDTFFRAMPLVLRECPTARFVCPAMQGESLALHWVRELGIDAAVDLLPLQTRPALAELFRQSLVTVSITEHDGTPNTLLEAMACGCYPVAGEIESLQEWITPGVNGTLVPADDPAALAQAILRALDSPHERHIAAAHNATLIQQRAEYGQCMAQAQAFYRQVCG